MKDNTRCDHLTESVIDSRLTESKYGGSTRRRRLCRTCGQRWTTYEVTESFLEEFQAALIVPKLIRAIPMAKMLLNELGAIKEEVSSKLTIANASEDI